jgi:hypothetical protein
MVVGGPNAADPRGQTVGVVVLTTSIQSAGVWAGAPICTRNTPPWIEPNTSGELDHNGLGEVSEPGTKYGRQVKPPKLFTHCETAAQPPLLVAHSGTPNQQ